MRAARRRAISQGMYKTYELVMEGEAGPLGFEPVTCRTDEELLAAARRLIEDKGLKAVEVRHFGDPLFTLEA